MHEHVSMTRQAGDRDETKTPLCVVIFLQPTGCSISLFESERPIGARRFGLARLGLCFDQLTLGLRLFKRPLFDICLLAGNVMNVSGALLVAISLVVNDRW